MLRRWFTSTMSGWTGRGIRTVFRDSKSLWGVGSLLSLTWWNQWLHDDRTEPLLVSTQHSGRFKGVPERSMIQW